MIDPIFSLTDFELSTIAAAIRSGRIACPPSPLSVQQICGEGQAVAVARAIGSLISTSAQPEVAASLIELLIRDRAMQRKSVPRIDVVTTGPEAFGALNRDTSVVTRELFAAASHSVLVVGFAVYQGQRVFSALADRMVAFPQLRVRLFLDVQRPPGDTSAPTEVARRFATRFVETQWPNERPLPSLYYFPQSLELDPTKRASLHAKCIVVDGQTAFVTSANFTEAAQQRNVELGLLIPSVEVAGQITRHFDALVADGTIIELLLKSNVK